MIKYCSTLVFLWLLWPAFSLQAQFTDDFSDGDFTDNPTWTADDANFVVEDETLRLLAPAEADESFLVTPSEAIENATWEFWVRMDFNPSGANYCDVFLVSNQSNLEGSVNGYFVRIGDADDEVSLYRVDGTSSTKIIDGVDDFVSMTNVQVRIQATRDDEGNWELSADNTGGSDFEMMGVVFDDTHIQSNYFGMKCVYTSTRSDKFYFDDFSVSGDPFVDDIPPVAESVEVLSSNELLVVFSEPLDPTSAEDPNNFDLQPFFGSPISAELDQESNMEITLEFATEMVNGNSYNLLVNGVADLSGNIMEPESFEFLFVIPEEADARDVVFNELMPDPNPPVNDLPDAEYIELFNASDQYIELENWELVNTSTVRFLPAYLFEPGAHVIVCHSDNVSLFEPYGDVIGVSSFVALTNTTDSLTLINPEGTIIDVVDYSSDWFNDSEKADGGWSLELINPETPCSGSQNWTASNDPNGGTPGEQNSVYDTTPDTDPPTLTDFNIIDPTNIQLFFNESLDPESLDDAIVSINPENGLADVAMSADHLSILLELENPIDTAVTYTVTIENITDCIGNPIGDQNSIEFLIGYIPGQHEVLINELMPDPAPVVSLPEQEYVELFNPTEKLFDLSACNISGATFPPNTFIEPGDFLVLVPTGTGELFEGIEPVVEMESMSSVFLTNSGKELELINPSGQLIDRVHYDISWYRDSEKIDGGWSLERINPEEPCRAGDNWRASVDPAGGTPGEQNSVYDTTPDDNAPRLNTILVLDSVTIELVFNEVLDSSSVISAGYSFSPDLTVLDIQNIAPDYHRIRLTFSETMVPNQVYMATIIGLFDCTGNEFENEGVTEFGRPGDITSGNLIINEVLFNQRTGGADFVEIYNNSDAIVRLSDWILGNLANEQVRLITEEAYVLFPGDYLAVTDDKLNILSEYPMAPENRVLEADDIPTYNNGDGQVVLMNPSGETVDRFDYFEDMHFALLNDVKGVSLERINFNRPSGDPTNWMSASEKVNWATPGYENSQFQPLAEAEDDISVEPEIFSPDNDGYQDVVSINYKFDRSGLAGNITIFDAAGREIRKLMRNELLGTDGTISWDGTDDNGERARVGIHIIYMEVFSTDGYTQGYKRSCVVASRF